jgi:proteic killer suppression protein
MITSFNGKDTKKLYGGVCPQKFLAIRGPPAPNLTLVDVAKTIELLKSPPRNRLEKLTGG